MQADINYEWHCPGGVYTGRAFAFHDHYSYSSGSRTYYRLAFHIDELSDDNTIMCAAKDFPQSMEYDSRLMQTIERWLGQDFIRTHRNNNGFFDIRSVLGREADLRVTLILNEKYKRPYSKVGAIWAPYTMSAKTRKNAPPADQPVTAATIITPPGLPAPPVITGPIILPAAPEDLAA